ncbi:MAG: hypothetical protein HY903_07675 [Deltaproteobacteria bacterium]|nr:hypothetical protein [Deltaproteobacteria bacterium]
MMRVLARCGRSARSLSGIALLVRLAGSAACAPTVPASPPVGVGAASTSTPPRVAPTTPADGRPTLLIMPLKSELGLETAARSLDELILTAAHGIGRYRVLGPADLNALLGVEALKDAVGCDDVSCAAEIGGALGAPLLVAGQLGKLGDQLLLSLRLMDTVGPAVLRRASARGGGDADSLGRRMSNNQYTEMLADLDRYERTTVAVPDNVNLAELLVFYRVTACFMLRRLQCMRTAAQDYLARFPAGLYASAVQSYVDQIEDAALQRDAKNDELGRRLKEIRAQLQQGALDPAQAQEMTAYAYFGAQHYEEAAPLFAALIESYQNKPDKMMELVQSLAIGLEQLGRFDQARGVLEKAEQRYPREFRLHGLAPQLRRLPK